MHEYRVVLNQCGAAIELHNVADNPVILLLLSPSRLEQWREKLASKNPDMRHASIGQVSMLAARELVHQPYLVTGPWTYNATNDKYERA